MKKYTEEQEIKIAEMVEAGATRTEIAAEIGVSYDAIRIGKFCDTRGYEQVNDNLLEFLKQCVVLIVDKHLRQINANVGRLTAKTGGVIF